MKINKFKWFVIILAIIILGTRLLLIINAIHNKTPIPQKLSTKLINNALNSNTNPSNNNMEGFSPKIYEMYRPYLRNGRVGITNFIGKWKNYIGVKFNRFF